MTLLGALRYFADWASRCIDKLASFQRVSEVFPAALAQDQDTYKNITVTSSVRTAKASGAGLGFNQVVNVGAFINCHLTGLPSNKIRIKRIIMQQEVQRAWRIMIFKKNTHEDADEDLDAFVSTVNFEAAQSVQYGGANQFYYDSGILDILYEDLDGTNTLHWGAQNNGPGNKAAAANDEGIIYFEFEPCA